MRLCGIVYKTATGQWAIRKLGYMRKGYDNPDTGGDIKATGAILARGATMAEALRNYSGKCKGGMRKTSKPEILLPRHKNKKKSAAKKKQPRLYRL